MIVEQLELTRKDFGCACQYLLDILVRFSELINCPEEWRLIEQKKVIK